MYLIQWVWNIFYGISQTFLEYILNEWYTWYNRINEVLMILLNILCGRIRTVIYVYVYLHMKYMNKNFCHHWKWALLSTEHWTVSVNIEFIHYWYCRFFVVVVAKSIVWDNKIYDSVGHNSRSLFNEMKRKTNVKSEE